MGECKNKRRKNDAEKVKVGDKMFKKMCELSFVSVSVRLNSER